jgi:hypothetical protein
VLRGCDQRARSSRRTRVPRGLSTRRDAASPSGSCITARDTCRITRGMYPPMEIVERRGRRPDQGSVHAAADDCPHHRGCTRRDRGLSRLAAQARGADGYRFGFGRARRLTAYAGCA